jgi:hypothetical protein
MNQNGKLHPQNDVLNFQNFLECLHLKVNIEKFSSHVVHSQQLSISQDMIELLQKYKCGVDLMNIL